MGARVRWFFGGGAGEGCQQEVVSVVAGCGCCAWCGVLRCIQLAARAAVVELLHLQPLTYPVCSGAPGKSKRLQALVRHGAGGRGGGSQRGGVEGLDVRAGQGGAGKQDLLCHVGSGMVLCCYMCCTGRRPPRTSAKHN